MKKFLSISLTLLLLTSCSTSAQGLGGVLNSILGGSGTRFKPLREGKRTFDLITVWMPPGEVPPPKMTLVSLG